MEYILYIAIGGCIFYFVLSHKKGDKNIVSHWYYHFEDLQTSSDEFYLFIEEYLKELAMPNIRISRFSAFEEGVNLQNDNTYAYTVETISFISVLLLTENVSSSVVG